ncbi:hypothetical protein [Streptomyces mexicanus]|uniref:Uncharacterized protein n=1 Tax=Streptomyces mexicanus TaxID=178566 RepID=A0A7X1I8S0_9ACTN|nr:hypothetical protein [Streptomyces mexicanus]MBC2869868.1 hypothetical protein [Streptomyces mexicanus]
MSTPELPTPTQWPAEEFTPDYTPPAWYLGHASPTFWPTTASAPPPWRLTDTSPEEDNSTPDTASATELPPAPDTA